VEPTPEARTDLLRASAIANERFYVAQRIHCIWVRRGRKRRAAAASGLGPTRISVGVLGGVRRNICGGLVGGAVEDVGRFYSGKYAVFDENLGLEPRSYAVVVARCGP